MNTPVNQLTYGARRLVSDVYLSLRNLAEWHWTQGYTVHISNLMGKMDIHNWHSNHSRPYCIPSLDRHNRNTRCVPPQSAFQGHSISDPSREPWLLSDWLEWEREWLCVIAFLTINERKYMEWMWTGLPTGFYNNPNVKHRDKLPSVSGFVSAMDPLCVPWDRYFHCGLDKFCFPID